MEVLMFSSTAGNGSSRILALPWPVVVIGVVLAGAVLLEIGFTLRLLSRALGGYRLVMNQNITYGASERYLEGQGKDYFEYQKSIAESNGPLLARKFDRYIRRSDCVLDFGCGGGYLLEALGCSRRIGVEINPAARAQAVKNGVECHAVLDTVPEGIADVVISNHALEHVPFPIEALRQIRLKLKERGTFVLCVPADDWRAQRRYDSEDVNHHLHTWTPLLLGHTLSEAGFRVRSDDIQILTDAWPPRVQLLWRTLPSPVFDIVCGLFAAVMNRRQILAVLQRDSGLGTIHE
jgi:SAM-dependent methyltransferase